MKLRKNPFALSYQPYYKISVFVIAIILLLSLFLYGYSSSVLYNLEYYFNLKLFAQFGYTLNQFDEQIKSDLVMLSLNPEFNYLLYGNEHDKKDVIKTSGYIDNVLRSDFIESIYMYNGTNDTYYIFGKQRLIRKSEEMADTGISDILHNLSQHNIAQAILRTVPQDHYSPAPAVSVLTYIFTERYHDNLQNSVVININVDEFMQHVINLNREGRYEQIMLLNNSGETIGVFPPGSVRSEALSTEIKEIAHTNKDSSWFMVKENGSSNIVSYVRLDSPEWILVCVSPVQSIVSNSFSRNVIMIVFLSLVLALMFSYYLTKKLTKPLDYLFLKMNDLFSDKKLSFDLHNLQEISENIDTLQNTLEQSSFYMKNQALKDILFNSQAKKSADRATAEHDNASAFFNGASEYAVCLFLVDNRSEAEETTELDTIVSRQVFIGNAQELSSGLLRYELIDISQDKLAAIVNTGKYGYTEAAIKETAEKIQREYYKFYHQSLSAFISDSGKPEDITKLYEDATHLSLYRVTCGQGCILTQAEFNRWELLNTTINHKDAQQLLTLINLSKLDEAVACLHNMIDSLKGHTYTSLTTSVNIIATSILNVLPTLPSEERAIIMSTCTSAFSNINSMETLEMMEARFIEIIRLIHESKQGSIKRAAADNVQYVVSYIENNYHDSSLCTATLADMVNMSPRQLSKEFQACTSQSIQNYINQYRIEKAKYLIISTNKSITDILQLIGWGSPKHFFTLFKKNAGMTPNEYRLKHKKNDAESERGD